MAKNINISLSLGTLACIQVVTSGFTDVDNVKNGTYILGLHTFVATATDTEFSLRALGVGLIVHLTSVSDVTVNSSPIADFTDITDSINALV